MKAKNIETVYLTNDSIYSKISGVEKFEFIQHDGINWIRVHKENEIVDVNLFHVIEIEYSDQ